MEALPDPIQTLLVAEAPHGAVVILRGVPGCGKSTLASAISTFCADPNDTWSCAVIRPDNEEDDAAERRCMGDFLLALQEQTDVIVVDKKNLMPEDYAWYEEQVMRTDSPGAGYSIHFVEFRCDSIAQSTMMANRSRERLTPVQIRQSWYLFKHLHVEDAIEVGQFGEANEEQL